MANNERLKMIQGIAVTAAIQALTAAAANPNVAIEARSPHAIHQAAQEIASKIVETPQVQHQISSEAWYQSRANWSWIFATLIAPAAAALGYNFAPEYQAASAVILAGACNLIAGYLARRARTASKPLFSK